jgi:hypothetical protein
VLGTGIYLQTKSLPFGVYILVERDKPLTELFKMFHINQKMKWGRQIERNGTVKAILD